MAGMTVRQRSRPMTEVAAQWTAMDMERSKLGGRGLCYSIAGVLFEAEGLIALPLFVTA